MNVFKGSLTLLFLGLFSAGNVEAGEISEAQKAAVEDLAAPLGLMEPPELSPITGELLDSRTEGLSSRMRYPVCQALSVSASNADAAVAMKGRIRELVSQGYSDTQIVDYFVDRYGEWVRLDPPTTGKHALVWAGPVVVTFLGVLIIAARLRNDDESNSAVVANTALATNSGTDTNVEPTPAAVNVYRAAVLKALAEKES